MENSRKETKNIGILGQILEKETKNIGILGRVLGNVKKREVGILRTFEIQENCFFVCLFILVFGFSAGHLLGFFRFVALFILFFRFFECNDQPMCRRGSSFFVFTFLPFRHLKQCGEETARSSYSHFYLLNI